MKDACEKKYILESYGKSMRFRRFIYFNEKGFAILRKKTKDCYVVNCSTTPGIEFFQSILFIH